MIVNVEDTYGFIVGEYVFEPDRLIFWPKSTSSIDKAKIYAHIATSDRYEHLNNKLLSYSPRNVQFKPGALLKAGICLTDNCSFRCNYCFESSIDGRKEQLSADDVMAFVSDIIKRWTIASFFSESEEPLHLTFTGGGEPTYNWDLFANSVRQIRQKCSANRVPLSIDLTTNGLLNKSQQVFIAEHCDSVMVSYDGMPEIQETNRRCANTHATTKSIEDAIRYFSKSPLHLTVRTTIWQDDFHHLREFADYIFSNFGTSMEWSIMPVIPTGRALNRVLKDYKQLRDGDFLFPYLNTIDYAQNRYGIVNITTPIFTQGLVSAFSCGALSCYCSCPWLLPDRTIITCIQYRDIKTIIGKIEDKQVIYLENIYDPLLEVYQQRFSNCRPCIAYRFCKGGCPARFLSTSVLMGNWECIMIRKYWTYIFENIVAGKECLGWHVVPIQIDGLEDIEVLSLAKA